MTAPDTPSHCTRAQTTCPDEPQTSASQAVTQGKGKGTLTEGTTPATTPQTTLVKKSQGKDDLDSDKPTTPLKEAKSMRCPILGCTVTKRFQSISRAHHHAVKHHKNLQPKYYHCVIPNCDHKGNTQISDLLYHYKNKQPDLADEFEIWLQGGEDTFPPPTTAQAGDTVPQGNDEPGKGEL